MCVLALGVAGLFWASTQLAWAYGKGRGRGGRHRSRSPPRGRHRLQGTAGGAADRGDPDPAREARRERAGVPPPLPGIPAVAGVRRTAVPGHPAVATRPGPDDRPSVRGRHPRTAHPATLTRLRQGSLKDRDRAGTGGGAGLERSVWNSPRYACWCPTSPPSTASTGTCSGSSRSSRPRGGPYAKLSPDTGHAAIALQDRAQLAGVLERLGAEPEGYRALVVLRVDNLDAAHAELTSRGADFVREPAPMGDRIRVAYLEDPEVEPDRAAGVAGAARQQWRRHCHVGWPGI